MATSFLLSTDGDHSYQVYQYRPGIRVVKGSIPCSEAAALCRAWEEMGISTLDLQIPQMIGACIVAGGPEELEALRREIDADAARLAKDLAGGDEQLEAELAWVGGCDTGISSQTMLRTLTAFSATRDILSGERFGSTGHPHDPSDLGRCLRLLERCPWLRDRLGEMPVVNPVWRSLVEAWSELEELYRSEVPNHNGPAHVTYRRIQELIRG